LSDAWHRLRDAAPRPVADLPAAVSHLEALRSDVVACNKALESADETWQQAMAGADDAEAALATHRQQVFACQEPTPENIVHHLPHIIGSSPGAVVLDEPFPDIAPPAFARVLSAVAVLATDRLVIYITDQVSACDGMGADAISGEPSRSVP